jgi:hypothetical protein
VWTGEWEDSGGLCHTLAVEEVLANGFARVTSSAGTSVSLGIPLPGFFRVTGRIVDGVMRFHGPGPERPEFAYRVTGETLSGTYKNEGHVRLTRLADVREVGCGRRDGDRPPPPSASGPRDRLTAAELWARAETGTGPVHTGYFLPVG